MGQDVIKELHSRAEYLEVFPVMNQLRTHLNESSYLALVEEAKENDHYRMAALYHKEKPVAVVGFMPMVTLYNGRFIWVCDLVTEEAERSNGYGEKLLQYVHDWASENGYPVVSLSSGLQRHAAHRFYEEKMDYDRVSYVFLKRLSE